MKPSCSLSWHVGLVQHGNKHVAMTARHLLEKWQLTVDATGPKQSSSQGPLHQPMQHSAPCLPRQRQAWQQPGDGPLSQPQLFSSKHMQVGSSMTHVNSPTGTVGSTQDAEAVGLTSFPDVGGGGPSLEPAQVRVRSIGDGHGGPGRIARSASSRPAQAARYASSPKVLWPEPAPPVPLTRATMVDAVPRPVLGGGRARPRLRAFVRDAGTAAGAATGAAAADGRQPSKQKKPAKKAKGPPSGPSMNFPLGRHAGTGIAALERQLQQLKATAAYDDLAWSNDLEPMPAATAVGDAPQNTQPAATIAPEFQGHAAGTSWRERRPASLPQEAPNKTGMHGRQVQDHAFWAKTPGVDMSLGSGGKRDRYVSDEEQEKEERTLTVDEAGSGRQTRQRLTRAARRSAETDTTMTSTTSTTDGAGGSKTLPTTWSSEDKACYIDVLQRHGRNLKRLCAAFPQKCASWPPA